jgi:hypothetical protein
MAGSTRRWKDVRSAQPVNEMRASIYRRLLEAEEQIAHARYRAGVEHRTVAAALDSVDENMSEAERREDLYLSALKYYVEALGGRLEVRAVFGDEGVVVWREPAS